MIVRRRKKQFQAAVNLVLAIALAVTGVFSPNTASASRKIASLRSAPRSASTSTADFRSRSTLSADDRLLLGRAMLAELAHAINDVRSPKEFREKILGRLTPEDEKDFKNEVNSLGTLPKAKMEGDFLVVKQGDQTVKAKWDGFPDPQFHLSGENWKVDWRITKNQSLKRQFEILKRKIELAKSHSTALNALLFPQAHADVIAIAGLVLAIVGLAGQYLPPVYCYIRVDAREEKGRVAGCDWYVAQKRTAIAETSGVKVDALEKSRSDATQESTDWLKDDDTKCPSKVDNSKNIYVANVREIDLQGTKVVKVGEQFRVRMMFQADGKPTEGFTAPMGTDMESEDALDIAKEKFRFDDKGTLKDIQIPNKAAKDDKTAPPFLPIDATTTDETKLTPEERAHRDQIRSLVKTINKWMQQCMDQDISKQVKEKEERTGAKSPDTNATSNTNVNPPSQQQPTGTNH
jgi:hypothetical protein